MTHLPDKRNVITVRYSEVQEYKRNKYSVGREPSNLGMPAIFVSSCYFVNVQWTCIVQADLP